MGRIDQDAARHKARGEPGEGKDGVRRTVVDEKEQVVLQPEHSESLGLDRKSVV